MFESQFQRADLPQQLISQDKLTSIASKAF